MTNRVAHKQRIQAMASFALGIGVVLLTAVVYADNCEKPNPNTVFCKDLPSDAQFTCNGLSPCEGAIYDIHNFPNGTVSSPEGSTKDAQAPCWRTKVCSLDTSVEPNICKAPASFTNWTPGTMKQVGDRECP